MKNEIMWDPNNLFALIKSTHMNIEDFEKAAGIESEVLDRCFNGEIPDMYSIIKIADYFSVPLDFLVGRCSEAQANSVIENYPRFFMELRRAPYESYLYGRLDEVGEIPEGYEAPYPYNLLEKVFEKPMDREIREEYLEQALDTLTMKEQEAIRLYYHNGFTLQEVGEQFGISRERIRQILAKGIRKLMHPARKKLIMSGWNSFDEIDAYAEKRTAELNEYEERLNAFDDALTVREDRLSTRESAICEAMQMLKKMKLDMGKVNDIAEGFGMRDDGYYYRSCCNIPIEDLDISVRTYNCLKRAGINTVVDILDKEPAELMNVKCLGKLCYEELLDKLHSYKFIDAAFARKAQSYGSANDMHETRTHRDR